MSGAGRASGERAIAIDLGGVWGCPVARGGLLAATRSQADGDERAATDSRPADRHQRTNRHGHQHGDADRDRHIHPEPVADSYADAVADAVADPVANADGGQGSAIRQCGGG